MAGEVLGAGDDARLLHAADARSAEFGGQAGVVAERPEADDVALALTGQVEHRREVEVAAQRGQFKSDDLAAHVGVIDRTDGGQCHVARQAGRVSDGGELSALPIDADQRHRLAPVSGGSAQARSQLAQLLQRRQVEVEQANAGDGSGADTF